MPNSCIDMRFCYVEAAAGAVMKGAAEAVGGVAGSACMRLMLGSGGRSSAAAIRGAPQSDRSLAVVYNILISFK